MFDNSVQNFSKKKIKKIAVYYGEFTTFTV